MIDAIEISLNPGAILYREGDAHDTAFIIEDGEVVLYSNSDGDMARVDCERRGPGSILGELSILTGQPRTVTVEALTPCKLYKIPAAKILHQFHDLDPILRACIETSISFSARLHAGHNSESKKAPLAQSTLRNSHDIISRIKFEKDILRGLERGEFSMCYQPIVSLSNGQIVGAEALMRWDHPNQGRISPDRFITVAEEMGSISLLTDFALSEACATLHAAQQTSDATQDLFMSVNVSGQDIGRTDFVDHLEHLLDLHALVPSHLKLEVTETALVPSGDTSERILERIREFGCGISIDDFGTGYSNLAYLKSLPLTALKIDRAFAGDAYANAVSKGIVRMLVGLGSELGVDIIAEGLETENDVQTLTELGCRYAQGFHFYKPLTKNVFLNELNGDQRSVTHVA